MDTQEWLQVMRVIDPQGHDERVLQTRAEALKVPFREFLGALAGGIMSTHGRTWVWAQLNDDDLMACFDRYRETHPI